MIHQGASPGLWDYLASCPSRLISALEKLRYNSWKVVKGWVLNFWFALWETLKAKWLIWLTMSIICHKTKMSDILSHKTLSKCLNPLWYCFVIFKIKGVDLIMSSFEVIPFKIVELLWAKTALHGGQVGLWARMTGFKSELLLTIITTLGESHNPYVSRYLCL